MDFGAETTVRLESPIKVKRTWRSQRSHFIWDEDPRPYVPKSKRGMLQMAHQTSKKSSTRRTPFFTCVAVTAKTSNPPIATTLAPALTYVASSSSICLSSGIKTVVLIRCRVRGGQRSFDSFASCLRTSDAGDDLHQRMRGDYLVASRHEFHRISKAGNVIRSAILILNSKMPSSVPT